MNTFGILFASGILLTLVVVLFFPRALHHIFSGSFNNPKLSDRELDRLPLTTDREVREQDLPPAIPWDKVEGASRSTWTPTMNNGRGFIAWFMSGFNSNTPVTVTPDATQGER